MAWVRLPDSKPREDLTLKMLPPVSLKGHVTDRQGKPVVGRDGLGCIRGGTIRFPACGRTNR